MIDRVYCLPSGENNVRDHPCLTGYEYEKPTIGSLYHYLPARECVEFDSAKSRP
jgi:hypothetical protein